MWRFMLAGLMCSSQFVLLPNRFLCECTIATGKQHLGWDHGKAFASLIRENQIVLINESAICDACQPSATTGLYGYNRAIDLDQVEIYHSRRQAHASPIRLET